MARARKAASDTLTTTATDKPLLPAGWQWVRFGEVVENVNETVKDPLAAGLERFVGLEHIEPRDLRIRSWGNVADGITFNRVFRAGQVLFGKRRAYQRKAALADFDGICSGDIYVLAADGKRLLPELLPFLVQAEDFAHYAEKTSEGSLSPRTKWSYLAGYEFALPCDPGEQRRIAEILRAAEAAVEAWRGAEDALSRVRVGRMNYWFDPARATSDPVWRVSRLDEFAHLQTGLALGKNYDGLDVERLPYLRVANVQDGHLDLSVMKEISVPKSEVERYTVRAGDVLMNEGGDHDKLGRGTVWRGEIERCLHQNHVFCIRPVEGKLSSQFLALQAESPYGKRYFLRCAKKTTNLASINSSQVRAFPLLWADLSLQHRIVSDFSEIAEAIGTCREPPRAKHSSETRARLLERARPAPPRSTPAIPGQFGVNRPRDVTAV